MAKIKKFFQLPLEHKLAIINDRTKNQQRGWCTPGEEKTWYLESNKGTIKEPKFSDSKVCLVFFFSFFLFSLSLFFPSRDTH